MLALKFLGCGLVLGVVFGFTLEKSRAFEPAMVLGQLQLQNFIMIKVFFTAVMTALAGTSLLYTLGMIHPNPRPLMFFGNAVGGLVMGAGIALAGACPGSLMVQLGVGYRDARYVLAGGLAGAFALVQLEPLLRPVLMEGGAGRITLDHVTRLPYAALGTALCVVLFACTLALERLRPWRLDLGPDGDGLHHSRTPTAPVSSLFDDHDDDDRVGDDEDELSSLAEE
jgi:hypothetical protein